MSSQRVSWIGLGNMGRGMARNISQKYPNLSGPLLVYNRTLQRSRDFSAATANTAVAETISAAVTAGEIIFTSLGDDGSVRAVYDEVLKEDLTGKLFIETSTILPETTDEIAEKVMGKGAEFVAAPVFGAPDMADAGSLIAVLAGSASSIARVSPFCNGVISHATIPLTSRTPGTASLLKLTGNTFILSMTETLAEGHVFAEKSGLGVDVLHSFIEHVMPGPFVAYSERMLKGDYYVRDEPLFGVDLARKDAGHAMKLAESVGVDLGIVKLADKHLVTVKEESGAKGDLPGIYGAVRKESGLPFKNKE